MTLEDNSAGVSGRSQILGDSQKGNQKEIRSGQGDIASSGFAGTREPESLWGTGAFGTQQRSAETVLEEGPVFRGQHQGHFFR